MSEKLPESSEKPAPEPEKPDAAKPIALTPRQSAGDRAPVPASAPPDAAAINQQLMSVLAQALTGQTPPAPPAAKDDRSLISREDKRFRRAGGPGRSDAPAEGKPEFTTDKPAEAPEDAPKHSVPTPPARPPTAPGAASPLVADVTPVKQETAPAERVGSASRRPRFGSDATPVVLRPKAPPLRTIWRQMPSGQKSAILTVTGALLAFLGFMVGRATPSSPTVSPSSGGAKPTPSATASASAVVTPRLAQPNEIKMIDDAMVAQTNGDFPAAEKLLQQLAREAPDISGNQTALALLSIQKGDMADADYHIKLGIDAGEDAGRLYGLRGMIEMRLAHPRRAIEAFEMATRSAPHQFKGYFLWAEYLRRIGKNQQALERFDQAISRVHEQADEDIMQFKRRLTLVAAGRGNELEQEMQQQLAMNPPSGDWLLIAMANAAQKYDFQSAAKYLERASQTMSQDALVDRLRDFYLYQWCYEKELEPYFQPLQKRLSAARRAEPVATEAKPGEDEPAASASPSAPAPK